MITALSNTSEGGGGEGRRTIAKLTRIIQSSGVLSRTAFTATPSRDRSSGGNPPWDQLSYASREAVPRPSLSFSLFLARAFTYSLQLRAAPSLFLPATSHLAGSPDSLLMVHISTRPTQSSAKERIRRDRIGRLLLHTRVRHGTVSVAVPNARSSCLDFSANSRRGKYENERETISGCRLFIIQSVIPVLTGWPK